MLDQIKVVWDKIQAILDLDGDVWLGLFTAAIVFRLVYSGLGHPPITAAEAAAYASCITAFAASNIGGPK